MRALSTFTLLCVFVRATTSASSPAWQNWASSDTQPKTSQSPSWQPWSSQACPAAPTVTVQGATVTVETTVTAQGSSPESCTPDTITVQGPSATTCHGKTTTITVSESAPMCEGGSIYSTLISTPTATADRVTVTEYFPQPTTVSASVTVTSTVYLPNPTSSCNGDGNGDSHGGSDNTTELVDTLLAALSGYLGTTYLSQINNTITESLSGLGAVLNQSLDSAIVAIDQSVREEISTEISQLNSNISSSINSTFSQILVNDIDASITRSLVQILNSSTDRSFTEILNQSFSVFLNNTISEVIASDVSSAMGQSLSEYFNQTFLSDFNGTFGELISADISSSMDQSLDRYFSSGDFASTIDKSLSSYLNGSAFNATLDEGLTEYFSSFAFSSLLNSTISSAIQNESNGGSSTNDSSTGSDPYLSSNLQAYFQSASFRNVLEYTLGQYFNNYNATANATASGPASDLVSRAVSDPSSIKADSNGNSLSFQAALNSFFATNNNQFDQAVQRELADYFDNHQLGDDNGLTSANNSHIPWWGILLIVLTILIGIILLLLLLWFCLSRRRKAKRRASEDDENNGFAKRGGAMGSDELGEKGQPDNAYGESNARKEFMNNDFNGKPGQAGIGAEATAAGGAAGTLANGAPRWEEDDGAEKGIAGAMAGAMGTEKDHHDDHENMCHRCGQSLEDCDCEEGPLYYYQVTLDKIRSWVSR